MRIVAAVSLDNADDLVQTVRATTNPKKSRHFGTSAITGDRIARRHGPAMLGQPRGLGQRQGVPKRESRGLEPSSSFHSR